MSQAANTRLMDTEPGGEDQNQYEAATSFTEPNTEHKPNFGDSKPLRGDALVQQQKAERERAAQKAEDMRYNDAITEHGFGGQTSPRAGDEGHKTHHGKYEIDEQAEERDRRDRAKQGYGEGSNVGA